MQPRVASVESEESDVHSSTIIPTVVRSDSSKRGTVPVLVGTTSGWWMRLTFLMSDIIALGIACSFSIALTNVVFRSSLFQLDQVEVKSLIMLCVSLIAVSVVLGSYGTIPPRPARQFRGWVIGTFYSTVGLVAALGMFQMISWRLSVLILITAFLGLFQAAFQRALCRMNFGKMRWWGTRFIVVGDGDDAIRAYERMHREPQWGLRPIGIVSDEPSDKLRLASAPYLGRPSQIDRIANNYGVIRAILIAHWFDSDEHVKYITQGTHRIRQWIALPAPLQFPSLWLDACEAARIPGWSITRNLTIPSMLVCKRATDFAITACLGLALLPLIALIAALIRLTSKGPIFFGHTRLGRDGRAFKAWKFRTMHPDGEQLLQDYLKSNPHLASEWAANHKLKSDPRVTWIGRKLRATSLDELPQLWNVLLGEMSLVGPRPIVSAEVEKYRDTYDLYRKVRPGITGLWQVSGRNNTTYEERVELDTYYVHNWSIWLDFYILACTIKVVLLGEGAY